MKRLKVKNDFIFQRIFGRKENKDILISFLNDIMELSDNNLLEDIEIIENTKLEKDRMEDKQGIVDVLAKTVAGVQITIEIQLINQYNMDKRTLFYWAKLFSDQLGEGRPFKGSYNEYFTMVFERTALIWIRKINSVYSYKVFCYLLTQQSRILPAITSAPMGVLSTAKRLIASLPSWSSMYTLTSS